MKGLLIFCCLLLTFSHSFSQTQFELNEAEHKKYLKADKELNGIYQKVLKQYTADTAFIKNLKTSQRLWVQFRDAEMKVKYPDRPDGYYGSVQPMCWSIYLTQLTEERINTLKALLRGTEEGDVCSGSVMLKE